MAVLPKVVRVHVRRLDGGINVSVFDEHRTVRDVKSFIDEEMNIPCECQRLVVGMCEVTDAETLANLVGVHRRRLRRKIPRVLDITLVRLPNAEEAIAHQHILEAIDTGAEICGRHYINRQPSGDSLVIDSPDIETIPGEIRHFAYKYPREITIRHCPRLTTLPVELFQLSCLSTLTIWNCRRLLRIPTEIRYLTALASLRIDDCQSISHIPNEIFDMTNLKSLTLCRLNVVVPSRIGFLHQLQDLRISHIAGITYLPIEIGRLPLLCVLYIYSCTNLYGLPDEVDCFPTLRYLSVLNCPVFSGLPSCARSLQSLQSLAIGSCDDILQLPEHLDCIRELNLAHCPRLSQIPERITDHMEGLPNCHVRIDQCPRIFLTRRQRDVLKKRPHPY